VNTAHQLGWTLIHSIWEIGIITVLFAFASLILRRADSRVRYCLAVAALTSCVLLPVGTYFSLTPPRAASTPPSPNYVTPRTPALTSPIVVSAISNDPSIPDLTQRVEPILYPIVLMWLVGLGMMLLRLLGGLVLIERAKRKCMGFINPNWQESVDSLRQRMAVKREVVLRISERLETPVVVGVFKSVILFPASVITKLSASDVEALLAHELAHVRRFDYLVNLIQTVVETVLFFHPGVWWISNVVRAEREHCCDDLAVSVLGDRQKYAGALMGLEQLRQPAPALAMAAGRGNLMWRIRRVLLLPDRPPIPAMVLVGVFVVLSASAVLAQTLNSPSAVTQGPPAILALAVSPTSVVAIGKAIPNISGHVIDANGRRVANAVVFWQYNIPARRNGPAFILQTSMEPKMSFPVLKTVTDASGTFRFEHLPDQPYSLYAYRADAGFGALSSNAAIKNDIHLHHSWPVRLRVTDDSGKPIAGIPIAPQVIGCDSNIWRLSADVIAEIGSTTDAQGRVTIEGLPVGAGFSFTTLDDRYVPDAPGVGAPVTLSSENHIVLHAGYVVSGNVTIDGRPLAGVGVDSSFGDGASRITVTGADGRFEVKKQPKGRVFLHVFPPPSVSKSKVGQTVQVDVGPSMLNPVHIALEHAQRLTGHVVGMPGISPGISHLTIHSAIDSGFVEANVVTAPDGSFKCWLPTGPHWINTVGPGPTYAYTQLTVEAHPKDITIHLPAPFDRSKENRISLLVLDADGNPARGVTVECRTEDGEAVAATVPSATDATGRTSVTVLGVETRPVVFRAQFQDQFSDPAIKPIGGKATIKLHRVALGSISGKVVDSAGKAIGGASIFISFMANNKFVFVGDTASEQSGSRRTAPDGSFHFHGLYPGTPIIVIARTPGFLQGQSSVHKVVGGKDFALPAITMHPKSHNLNHAN